MNATITLGIVGAVVLATLALGLAGVRGVRMDPQEYIVGGRRIGAVLLWLLLAGEIYTTFTFLGAAGWAYGKGAQAYYILCYGTLAFVIAFFLTPAIHRIARDRKLLTGPDFFTERYGSRPLGALVALLGFAMLVPYVTLQLSGIQILVRIASFGRIDPLLAVGIAFLLIAVFTYLVGLRGTAWAAVAKDGLVLIGVVFAGIVLPSHFFGSPAGALDAVQRDHPNWLTIAGPGAPNGITWVISTTLMTACGFFMWPQSMAAVYSAKSEDTLRRNAIFLPFYQLMLLLVFFAGFAALEIIPGLKGPAADQSYMLVVQQTYPAWILGIVTAAGVLAGLVPAAGQLLAAASIVGKNVLADYGIARGDAAQTLATRILVLIVALLAFGFWALAHTTLVGL
ncbi:MAG: sodium:solute symporter family protein, partial [Vulcanimicrobiaceae bacterium]